jgi:hypothetical protein
VSFYIQVIRESIATLNTTRYFGHYMPGSGSINNVTPRVPTSKGSTLTKQLGGVDQEEGIALLVSDTGRGGFSSPLHPQLTIGTTAKSLDGFISAEYANLTAAQRTLFGISAVDEVPVPIIAKRGFIFKADAANSNTIFVGTSHVSATALKVGFPLAAGDSLFVEITNSKNIWFDGGASGQELYWLAI